MEARRRIGSNAESLEAEAERLYKHLVVYAKTCREDGFTNYSTILESFYSDVLGLDGNTGSGAVKGSLTRRFRKIAKKYTVSDPEKQRTLDNFIL